MGIASNEYEHCTGCAALRHCVRQSTQKRQYTQRFTLTRGACCASADAPRPRTGAVAHLLRTASDKTLLKQTQAVEIRTPLEYYLRRIRRRDDDVPWGPRIRAAACLTASPGETLGVHEEWNETD
jgi:hypothetical protein